MKIESGYHWLVRLTDVKLPKLSKASVNFSFFTDFKGLENGQSFSLNSQRQ